MQQIFLAEIKRVEAKKMASLDMEIRLTVATDETEVLDLGKIPSDQVVKITVETVEKPPSAEDDSESNVTIEGGEWKYWKE